MRGLMKNVAHSIDDNWPRLSRDIKHALQAQKVRAMGGDYEEKPHRQAYPVLRFFDHQGHGPDAGVMAVDSVMMLVMFVTSAAV